MFKDGKLSFNSEDESLNNQKIMRLWNVLIIDDEPAVHDVTKLALRDFEFEGRKCNFLHAYSAEEAKGILETTPNIALAFVDVVMETDDAGLKLVDYIRKEIKNNLIRLVLRTGQPGQAPEERVISEYDINDYKSKNELTTQKLYTTVYTGLRAYRDIIALEKNRQGLKKIISSTASIEKMPSLELFLSAVLDQLSAILHIGNFDYDEIVPAFIAAIRDDACVHIAGSGIYKDLKHNNLSQEYTQEIKPLIMKAIQDTHEVYENGHYILYTPSNLEFNGFVIYIQLEKDLDELDKDLIRLFLENAKVAYENTVLTHELDESQREVIFTISEIAEQRSQETGKHVKRVAMYSKLLAELIGLNQKEVQTIYAAAPMHDIGKIAIPDSILKKPGKLDEDEFEIMKTHAEIGYKVLKSSKREILRMSAVIAKEHHEKYDGSGYPNALKGEDIHVFARIVALADVFDALGTDRAYKKAWELEDIYTLVREGRGKHFDPQLVDLFFENIDKFLEIRENIKD
ncbi:DUF3369 domain-containing protein [Sulfurimonas sp.]|nr:DUF3369 domain-containing protein [Sulfurimonas sp.]